MAEHHLISTEEDSNNRKHVNQTLSQVLVMLMKGVLYNDKSPDIWQELLSLQSAVKDYFEIIGLNVYIDEAEGYAFLKQAPEYDARMPSPPKLIMKRALSYPISLLCVLLRKKLVELDASGDETRLIVTQDQIVDMIHVFLPEGKNEARVIDQIHIHIKKLTDFGFLRKMKGSEAGFEVKRIIKALVDADWLDDFGNRLKDYRDYVEKQK